MTSAPPLPVRVGVLADDLIWSTRLAAILHMAGATPVVARRPAALAPSELTPDAPAGVVVDLTARAYDGIAAVRDLVAVGRSVVCVAQHDDDMTRRAALAAGARSVLPYRTLHEKGGAALERWLAELRAMAA